MMSNPNNGASPPVPPAQPPGPPIPLVKIIYKQHPNGLRTFVGLDIGGQMVGGLVAVDTGFDVTQLLAAGIPNTFVALTLKVAWPWLWQEEGHKEVLVATRIP